MTIYFHCHPEWSPLVKGLFD